MTSAWIASPQARRVETRRWNSGKSAFADCGVGIRATLLAAVLPVLATPSAAAAHGPPAIPLPRDLYDAITRFVVERGRLPAEQRRVLEGTLVAADA